LQWTTFRGGVLDRDSYIDGNTNGSLRWHAQRLLDPEVVVVGDTAVLTALVVDEVEHEDGPETFRLRLTQTWVRQEGRWLCLSGHAGPRLQG
jgi:ketosteroid isomerase-like protein